MGVAAVAVNMRLAIAGFSPLAEDIGSDLDADAQQIALVTAIPLVCFASFAMVVPRAVVRFGVERTALAMFAILTCGMLVRAGGSLGALWLGTLLVGIALSAANIMLPGLIKRSYPLRIGLATGVFSVISAVASAAASAGTVPLGRLFELSWEGGLLIWAVPAGGGLIVWVALWRMRPFERVAQVRALRPSARPRVAFAIALYLGFQSFVFYSTLAWYPSILVEQGLSETDAGLALGLVQLAALPALLILPVVAGRLRRQSALVLVCGLTQAAGLVGLLVATAQATWCWSVLLGVGSAGFPVALTLIGLRSSSSQEADQISGFSQTLGYALAASGPLLVGGAHQVWGSWSPGIGMLIVATVILIGGGMCAGAPPRRRDGALDQTEPRDDLLLPKPI